jgi:hypothetical protein
MQQLPTFPAGVGNARFLFARLTGIQEAYHIRILSAPVTRGVTTDAPPYVIPRSD